MSDKKGQPKTSRLHKRECTWKWHFKEESVSPNKDKLSHVIENTAPLHVMWKFTEYRGHFEIKRN